MPRASGTSYYVKLVMALDKSQSKTNWEVNGVNILLYPGMTRYHV